MKLIFLMRLRGRWERNRLTIVRIWLVIMSSLRLNFLRLLLNFLSMRLRKRMCFHLRLWRLRLRLRMCLGMVLRVILLPKRCRQTSASHIAIMPAPS